MNLKKRILKVILCSLVPFLLCGQENDSIKKDSIKNYKLQDLVVSATRTLRQLSSLPLQVQLISKKDIQKIHSSRLSDLLAEQNGILIVPGHTGGSGVQLQGIDSEYTMILLDGMPLVGRSTGTLDLSRISVGDIEQVEIVKGASSSLYGSEALGGVINIITKKGKRGFHSDINYRLSRFSTHDASLNIGYNTKKYGVSAFANYYKSNGYNLSDSEAPTIAPYKTYTTRTKGFYKINENTNFDLSFRNYWLDQGYQTSESINSAGIKEWNAHFRFNHDFNDKWNSFLELYSTRYKTNQQFLNKKSAEEYKSDYDEKVSRIEMRTTYKPLSNTTYMLGAGWNYRGIDKTTFSEPPQMSSFFAYMQYEAFFFKKLNVIGGMRYDYHQSYPSQISPKVALKYDFNDKFSVKASVGYGYKAPDFRNLYYNFTNPAVGYTVLGTLALPKRIRELQKQGQILRMLIPLNQLKREPLKPESSISYNFGFSYTPFNGLDFNVNLFRNDIKNLIDSRAVARKTNGQNVFSYYNVNKIYTKGLETDVVYHITPNIKFSAGYQLLYAKSKSVEKEFKNGKVYARDKKGNDFKLKASDYFGLPNRSRHVVNAKLYVEIPAWKTDFNIRWIYRSSYALYDTNSNTYIDKYDDFVHGYSLVNMAINKKISKNIALGVGVNNLFNYTDKENISKLPGRIGYINLNVKL